MPAAAPQQSPSHPALRWLIRGTGAIIAIPSAFFVAFALVMGVVFAFHHPENQSWFGIAIMLISVLFYGVIAKVGWDMWRKINPVSVANFTFIFSFLTASTLYHLLPLNLPKILANHVGDHAPFLAQGSEPGFSYRATFAFIAFVIFYRITKAYLLRVLELNPPASPQDSTPSVPPDPYDLSKNAPIFPHGSSPQEQL
jgi:hypothetical protein